LFKKNELLFFYKHEQKLFGININNKF